MRKEGREKGEGVEEKKTNRGRAKEVVERMRKEETKRVGKEKR